MKKRFLSAGSIFIIVILVFLASGCKSDEIHIYISRDFRGDINIIEGSENRDEPFFAVERNAGLLNAETNIYEYYPGPDNMLIVENLKPFKKYQNISVMYFAYEPEYQSAPAIIAIGMSVELDKSQYEIKKDKSGLILTIK